LLEHRHQPLLPFHSYLRRVAKSLGAALLVVAVGLGVGVAGYAWFEELPLVDAVLNAAMILGGMGPVDLPMKTTGGKLFAAWYALFSGVVFLVASGILFAPILHRFLHRFHLDR
jgi:hypothetical protein